MLNFSAITLENSQIKFYQRKVKIRQPGSKIKTECCWLVTSSICLISLIVSCVIISKEIRTNVEELC